MTLFDSASHEEAPQKHVKTPQERKRTRGITFLVGSLILVIALAAVPTGFVIEQPGPVFNTLGEVEVPQPDSNQTEKVPLITIEGASTFPTTGELDLLTVSVLGNPEQTPSWLEVASAWFDSSKAVVPMDAIFPKDESKEDRDQAATAQMVDSQQDAIAAALTYQGYDVIEGIAVMGIRVDSPAKNVLQEGDVITEVNGVVVKSVPELREQLALNGLDKPATIEYLRQGEPGTAEITPIDVDGNTVLAIAAKVLYDFPFDVNIRLDDVGGPSAGLMFALGIIDKLSPEDETNGVHFAGTGTIDAQGNVGSIGGIKQKLFGARSAGATVAFIPTDNCAEAKGAIPSGLDVYTVDTLSDAMKVLSFIKMHEENASTMNNMSGMFPTCQN